MDARNGLGIVELIANTDTRDLTHRSHVNTFYRTAAANFIGEHFSELPQAGKLVRPVKGSYIPCKTGLSVLEQLGRMIEQDGYSEQDVLLISDLASRMLDRGFTVKEVERYIRLGRKTGKWID